MQNVRFQVHTYHFAFVILHFAFCDSFTYSEVMPSIADQLPFTQSAVPVDQAGVADAVRAAYEEKTAVYPLGGRTAQDYGMAPTRGGVGLDLTALAKIVDYTPRDMTILVEAGVRMADLRATLAAEGQQLPIDVPRASEATIGGVVATNWNGPRRYGQGTIRDYVIGIQAADGRGTAFKGGGRVVKNVAGYDFCRLLCGSLGTLGVITQLALKVKPLPQRSAVIVAECLTLENAERILERLAQLDAQPVAIDLLVGASWQLETTVGSPKSEIQNFVTVVVRVEGTESETAWFAERVQYELWSGGGAAVRVVDESKAAELWSRQVEFSDRGPGNEGDDSTMVLKIAVPPSAVSTIIAELLSFDPDCEIQAHAGNGIIFARFTRFTHGDLTSVLVGKLRPAAVKLGGSVVIVSSRLDGLTPHIVWGGRAEATMLAERIKQKFDPHNILNPGRFVF
jgi:glycolate oxidase FAD binding subunit